MQYRTRPQSPHGVKRTPLVPVLGVWRWLQQRILQTHANHQFVPGRFHLRAISISLLIAIPALLWIRASLQRSDLPNVQWSQGACPPSPAVPLEQVARTPERFQRRIIWITGKLYMTQRVCSKLPCSPSQKNCCKPCQARLMLRQSNAQLLLDGWVNTAQSSGKRIACRGSTCSMSCAPLQPNRVYAMSGYVKGRWLEQGPHKLSYQMRSFHVLRFCETTQLNPYLRPKLRDPRYRKRRTTR